MFFCFYCHHVFLKYHQKVKKLHNFRCEIEICTFLKVMSKKWITKVLFSRELGSNWKYFYWSFPMLKLNARKESVYLSYLQLIIDLRPMNRDSYNSFQNVFKTFGIYHRTTPHRFKKRNLLNMLYLLLLFARKANILGGYRSNIYWWSGSYIYKTRLWAFLIYQWFFNKYIVI